jgi:DNA-binding Lrp family transcriptional regulator
MDNANRLSIDMAIAAKRAPALDRIDIRILAALQKNGRSTIQKLAANVGLSSRACLERVRRLEAARIISGYRAVIDLGLLSRPITVFTEIALEKHGHRDRFERHVTAIEEVVECWEVSGAFDYLARFVCADLANYEALTTGLLDHPNLGIARIVSHVALRPVRRFAGYPDALLAPKPG